MRHLWRGLLLVLLTTCSERGDDNKFTDDELAILESASEIEVYSLDPAPRLLHAERFNFWSVLGKTTVIDFQQKNELVFALKNAVKKPEKPPTDCFLPRYGLRAKMGKEVLDMTISFECKRIAVYQIKKPAHLMINDNPEGMLDNLLKRANIPQAAKPATSR